MTSEVNFVVVDVGGIVSAAADAANSAKTTTLLTVISMH